jgi:four helix bundle protein
VNARYPLIGAARAVADEVNELIDGSRRRLIHTPQLREAAQSIPANIREALGRRRGPEREQFFRFARGSAEETDEHLRANFAARRLPSQSYLRLHNRLALIVRILKSFSPEP